MQKSVAEKTLDGSLLDKLEEPRYFIMFAAFGLYWDSCARLFLGTGLLSVEYKIGDSFPLGNIFALISTFSLLASIVSPFFFWVLNYIFWQLWFLIPECIRPKMRNEKWIDHLNDFVAAHKLKIWAIKSNNSMAMSLVQREEIESSNSYKNRPAPFLLALCIVANYYFVNHGMLDTLQKALPNRIGENYSIFILLFVSLLLYLSLTGFRDHDGQIYLPGMGKHIANSDKKNQQSGS